MGHLEKLIMFIVATNVDASRPPERRRTGTQTTHAKMPMPVFLVARINSEKPQWTGLRVLIFANYLYTFQGQRNAISEFLMTSVRQSIITSCTSQWGKSEEIQ